MTPPKLPICFMLDELATLGHLETVENAVGLSAGYGIQFVTVFQDTAQMKDLYKNRWASFIGNSGVRALFNLDDFDTAEYWSKFVGTRLIENRSQQQDIYGFSKGENVGETMRADRTREDDVGFCIRRPFVREAEQNARPRARCASDRHRSRGVF
jgi:type IV secretory pathway TraG/TraD family ATPase VirD4